MDQDPVRIKTKTKIIVTTTTTPTTIKTVIGRILTMDTTAMEVVLLLLLVVLQRVTDSFINCFIKILPEVAAAVVVPLPLLHTILLLLLRVVMDTIQETLIIITKPDLITTMEITTAAITTNITPTTMMTLQHPAPILTLAQVLPPLPKTRMHSILVL